MSIQSNQIYYGSTAIIIIILNALSFITLSFVILIYTLKWKKISSFPMRLSFYLCIACIIQNLYVLILNPILVNDYEKSSVTSGYCKFQGILKVTSDLASIVWTTLIIYSVFASIVLKKDLKNAEISYLLIGYLFPFVFAIIPVIFDLYGYDTYFCWFDVEQNLQVQFILKMVYYFCPLWVAFFLNIFMSIKAYRTLKKIGLDQKQLLVFKRLMLFPLIMLSTGFFATISVIYQYSSDKDPQWLDVVSNICQSLYGFFNSIAYGFNPIIRQQIQIVLGIRKKQTIQERQMSDNTSRRSHQTDRLSQLMG